MACLPLVLHPGATGYLGGKAACASQCAALPSNGLDKNSHVLLQGRVDSLLLRRAQVASVQLEVD